MRVGIYIVCVGRFGKQPPSEVFNLTRAGRKQIQKESRRWEQTAAIVALFLSPGEEPL